MTNAVAPAARVGKRRGSYAKSEETRRSILDAALEVFAQSGYRSGSLREVAERVGMSEAGLLHHFPNKSALLAAVLERRDDRSLSFVPFDDDIDPVVTLRGLVALARYNASVPGVVELYCTLSAEATSPDHPAHDSFQRRYAWTLESVETRFRLLADQGRLREGVTPGAAARSTIAVMDGLQVQWLLDRASVDMADEIALHLERLVDDSFRDA